jgi:hypothetical protein
MTLLREFAVEPACLGHSPELASQVLSIIECGRGTVVAECPRKWVKAAHAAIEQWKSGQPRRAKKVVERLNHLKATSLFPGRPSWDTRLSWPDAAFTEHQRAPFDLVMSKEERAAAAWMRLPDEFDPLDPRLAAAHETLVPRTAAAMADVVAPLLRASKQIVFVDPYFEGASPRFIKPLRAWLQVIEDGGRTPTRLEYHTRWREGSGLHADCANLASNCDFIPADWRLSVINWKERQNGEKMHARYIITERGAVRFDAGLDEGRSSSETTPVTLLPYSEHQHWLSTFNEQASVFVKHDTIIDIFAHGNFARRSALSPQR